MIKILKNCNVNNRILDIKIENSSIIAVGNFTESGIDMGAMTVIPGLIDIHTHGAVGYDTMDANLAPISEFMAKNGVTSFLPTTMAMTIEKIKRVTNEIPKVEGASILGFHMEGPYFCKKFKGAQNEKYLKNPDTDEFLKLKNIKMVTLAPELDGAMDFIKNCKAVVSLGHTDCDYDTGEAAFLAGAKCITHMYNAMKPMLHREPSLIGAAIVNNSYAQIICDGIHVKKAAVIAAYRAFGVEKLILISDSMRAAGLTDGEYDLGGQICIVKDNAARTKEGNLAGSIVSLWHCVRKAEEFGIPFDDCVKMSSETPAKLLGIKKGKIDVGYDADLLVLNEKKEIEKVMIMGKFFKI